MTITMARRLAGPVLLLILSVMSLVILSASLAAAQAVPERVRTSESVAQGLLAHKVQPVYPPLARQARIQGAIVLKVHINKSGDVESTQLVSGHPLLAPAAIEAVKQWKYMPYLLNGEPVAVETQVTVNFTLSGNAPASDVPGDNSNAAPDQPSADDAQPAVAQRIRVSQAVSQKLLKTKVNPDYPPDARDQRIEGVVQLKVIIDKDGNVAQVDLIGGHPLLAPAAIDAVKQWKYEPYLLNGNPLVVETTVRVNFTLEN